MAWSRAALWKAMLSSDDAARVGHSFCQGLNVGAAGDGAQAVAQPLHDGATDKHAAFNSKFRRGGGLRRAGRNQVIG